MSVNRAAPNVPNAVTGNSEAPPPEKDPIAKLTVRLTPGALAALDRGELTERLAKYDTSTGYVDITKPRSLKMEVPEYARLVERASSAGMTVNKFLGKLLIDPLFGPDDVPALASPPTSAPPEPEAVAPPPVAPPVTLPRITNLSRAPRIDPQCSVLVSTQIDPAHKVVSISWERGTVLPSVPTIEDVDATNNYRVGALAWLKVPAMPIPPTMTGQPQPLIVHAPDTLMVNVTGDQRGWVQMSRNWESFFTEMNYIEMHVIKNARIDVAVWPNHTFNTSRILEW